MRKSLSIILTLAVLLGMLCLPVQAAAMDSYAGAVTTSGNSLNVRSAPSTASSVVGSLKKGSFVTLLSRSGSWWQVEFGRNQIGYCHADYITPVQGMPVQVAVDSALTVRSGPGTSFTPVNYLGRGAVVLRLTESNGWSRILFHGTKTGYVSSQYLTSGQEGGAVRLSVPNFKQTDSRWANVTIGASGKTMAKIGCATTAIAMMESHRTGSPITPDVMAKKLNYTSSGSVYWPGHYTTVTSSSGYLSKILRLLQQGKPVLFGAKNAYGTQHWVVITGFTGGSVTAENFTVNDPGSNSRTTLQQFLSAYPTFYKYFHY